MLSGVAALGGRVAVGVRGGYIGAGRLLPSRIGATRDDQGSRNGLPSTRRVSKALRWLSQAGSEYIRFLRMLRVCSVVTACIDCGRLDIPVLSAINTLRLVS